MLRNIRLPLSAALVLATSTAALPQAMTESAKPPFPTGVLTEAKARYDEGPWGKIWILAEGNTVGTNEMFVGKIELKPGAEVHPPHEHAEEEYLLVLSGRGSWTIGDKRFEAKAGDLLYARPWDLHGIVAAPDSELTFFIWKWRSEPPKSGVAAGKPN